MKGCHKFKLRWIRPLSVALVNPTLHFLRIVTHPQHFPHLREDVIFFKGKEMTHRFCQFRRHRLQIHLAVWSHSQ